MVNRELMKMARATFEKSAVVPSEAAMMGMQPDPSQMGAAPPVDPAQAAMGAAPPPAAQDPTGAGAAAMPPAPAPMPAPAPAAPPGAAQGQKMKPEQMMQMIDFRLYNMQQQLTAIMNAMGVQVDPATLVLPPGSNGAPPAESALPGGPMAPPPPQDPNAAGGPQPPGGPMPPGGPQDPSQMPMDPNAGKQAWWEQVTAELPDPDAPSELQLKAAALSVLRRSLGRAR